MDILLYSIRLFYLIQRINPEFFYICIGSIFTAKSCCFWRKGLVKGVIDKSCEVKLNPWNEINKWASVSTQCSRNINNVVGLQHDLEGHTIESTSTSNDRVTITMVISHSLQWPYDPPEHPTTRSIYGTQFNPKNHGKFNIWKCCIELHHYFVPLLLLIKSWCKFMIHAIKKLSKISWKTTVISPLSSPFVL